MPSLPPSTTTIIPPSAMPLISPPALLHAHLSQTPPLRPSSRLPSSPRPISLTTSTLTHANGSSLLRTGDTSIVSGVRAELLPVSAIANYRVKRTDTGTTQDIPEEEDYTEVIANNLLVPNIELNTGCSPSYLPGGPPSVLAQSISQRLLDLLHGSRVVVKESLKIYYTPPPDEDGEEQPPQLMAYWCLYIDLVCISSGGNVFDAAWMAVCAALRDTVLPRGWWDADVREVRCEAERGEGRGLDVRGMPVALSWGVFVPERRISRGEKGDMWVLVDLDAFEEECCQEGGCLVVDVDEGGRVEILKMEKNGGGRVEARELRMLLGLAGKRWKEWEKVVMAG